MGDINKYELSDLNELISDTVGCIMRAAGCLDSCSYKLNEVEKARVCVPQDDDSICEKIDKAKMTLHEMVDIIEKLPIERVFPKKHL